MIANWIKRLYDLLWEPIEFLMRLFPMASLDNETVVIISTPQVKEETVTESTPTPPTPKATLENMCLEIRAHEGWILPGGKDWKGKVYLKGSRSYQNNNPGNTRYFTGGYLPTYGNVLKDADGFARFRDYETGWLYLTNMVRHQIFKHPDWTLLQFFERYAPKEDANDPELYSKVVAKAMGVNNLYLLRDIRV